MEILVRNACSADRDLLWEFLAIAAYEPSAQAARGVSVLAPLVEGWKRPGDFGCIAEVEGRAVAAAWARQYEPKDAPAIYVGPNVPEITIGVYPEARGRGLGGRLLDWLAQTARSRGCQGLCLVVRDTSPALRLYERLGYRRIPRSVAENRSGARLVGMCYTF